MQGRKIMDVLERTANSCWASLKAIETVYHRAPQSQTVKRAWQTILGHRRTLNKFLKGVDSECELDGSSPLLDKIRLEVGSSQQPMIEQLYHLLFEVDECLAYDKSLPDFPDDTASIRQLNYEISFSKILCKDLVQLPSEFSGEPRCGHTKKQRERFRGRLDQIRALKKQLDESIADKKLVSRAKNWLGERWHKQPAHDKPHWYKCERCFSSQERVELIDLRSRLVVLLDISAPRN